MAAFRLPSFLQRRWLWALAGGLVAVPSLVLAWLYWWLLPNLPQYKDEITGILSSATGYAITVESLDGEWGGARPRFVLEGVRISEGGRPLLYFDRLQGRFGWRSLIALEPRFHELEVVAPGLTVRRAQDGMIHVGGFKVDPNSPDTSFSDWLLRQGVVRMQGATVAWVDDTRDGRPLVLREVAFELQNLLNRHAFRLALTPPAHLARPLALDGVLYGRSLAKREAWRGKMQLDIPALELAAWQPWLPQELAQARGHGSIAAELGIERGRLALVDGQLNLADLYLAPPSLPSPIDLARLSGGIGWGRDEVRGSAPTQIVHARQLTLADRTGISAGPFVLSFRWGDGEQRLAAAHLALGDLAALAPALPLEQAWKSRIGALAPRGQMDSLKLRWSGHDLEAGKFTVDARFTALGWAAEGKRPGAENLSGTLSGSEKKGAFNLAGKQAGLALPALFPVPSFGFDILNLRGGWKQTRPGHYAVDVAEAALSNADFAATLHGQYRFGGGGPGQADLVGRLERAHGPHIERYLPFAVNEDTLAWLRASVLHGEVSQGTFKLQGDLAKFPFARQEDGVFRVAGRISGGQLRFAPDYPRIDDIEGELAFDGARMEIRAERARIFGAHLRKVKAVIPDLETHDELLEVSGEAQGPAQEFIRFANFSPVAEKIEGITEAMTATGDLRLQMDIKVPLRRSERTTLAGRLVFDRNTVFSGPEHPRLEEVAGALDFTEAAVSARRIAARLLGGAAAFTVASEGGAVRVRGQGVFTAAALDSWLGRDIAGRLSGQASWKGELRLARGSTGFRLESSLRGIESRLPAPLAKPADKAATFVFEQQGMPDGGKSSRLQYANIVSASWIAGPTPAGFRLQRGELNFGGMAQLPDEPGLRIAGSVNSFDLGAWADIAPQGQDGRSTGVSEINLSLGSLDFLGRRFHDIAVAGKFRGDLLRVAVSGHGLDGSLAYRRANGASPSRISAQFGQFVLPDSATPLAGGTQAAMRLRAAGFPAFDLQVEDLRLGSRPMGRLEIVAHGVTDGMAIEQLNVVHPDSVIRMSGNWKDTGLGETRMKMNVDIKDAGLMLGRFGYANTMRKGAATVEGEVTWLRSPADFTFDTLDGTLRLHAKNGQFLRIEPGAGKLLGIASLQSLPRRITLDFRDVFSQGFAFDEISSTMQVADGTVYTSDFLMKGPSASVKMSGMASLRDETVKLRVKVTPKLSEGVAVAGALLGGPIAGVGALVVQKVLKDPFEEAISYEYLVDGTWDNPAVTKLAKPKSVQEKEPDS